MNRSTAGVYFERRDTMLNWNVDRAHLHWRFWLIWMSANIGGVFLFILSVPIFYAILVPFVPGLQDGVLVPDQQWLVSAINQLSIAALGAVIGLAQWLILRRYLPRLGWWVLATAIGYTVPFMWGFFLPIQEPAWLAGASMFLMFGATLGILQWLLLRHRLIDSAWWIALSVGSWLLAYAMTGVAYLSGLYIEPFDMLAAFLVPIASAGAGMIWLLRRSASTVPASR
jgi:hypothetical protein